MSDGDFAPNSARLIGAMFLWTGRQAAFALLMVVVCAMALINPGWRHWYHTIVPPLLLVMMFLALSYALRK
jgi:hypothetical protein